MVGAVEISEAGGVVEPVELVELVEFAESVGFAELADFAEPVENVRGLGVRALAVAVAVEE